MPAVQEICDSLGPEHIDALLRKWLAILPNPFTPEDETAGYRYELSILQAEFSLTQMLDRPVSGRIFFEQVLHDNLDIGRPDQVSLVFDRRIIGKGRSATPGRFRTRVITDGVIPSLHVDYKNTKVKQYHKEGRALRTGPGSGDALLRRRPLRTVHARSRAHGPSRPLGVLGSSAVVPRCFLLSGWSFWSGRRPRVRGVFVGRAAPWACCRGLGSPLRSPSW